MRQTSIYDFMDRKVMEGPNRNLILRSLESATRRRGNGVNIVDFGDVIPGARKTYNRYGKEESIESVIAAATGGLTRLWPIKKTYEEMREQGIRPEVASLVMSFRQMFRIFPFGRDASDLRFQLSIEEKEEQLLDRLQYYEETVKKVKDGLLAAVQPEHDLHSALEAVAGKLGELGILSEREAGEDRPFRARYLLGEEGKRGEEEYRVLDGKKLVSLFSPKAVRRQKERTEGVSWDELLERRKGKERGKRREGGVSGVDIDEVKVDDELPDLDAEKYRKIITNAEFLKTVKIWGPDTGGILDVVEEEGGEAATQKILDTFRVRGGQFGNWLNQRERRETLDLFSRSAEMMTAALGLPSEAFGFDGELGCSWGARGIPGAAGHYEPGQRVFNLTKYHGAGSLAHEWMHALHHRILLNGVRDEKSRTAFYNIDLGVKSGLAAIRVHEAEGKEILREIEAISKEWAEAAKSGTLQEEAEGLSARARNAEERAIAHLRASGGIYRLAEIQIGIRYPEVFKITDDKIEYIHKFGNIRGEDGKGALGIEVGDFLSSISPRIVPSGETVKKNLSSSFRIYKKESMEKVVVFGKEIIDRYHRGHKGQEDKPRYTVDLLKNAELAARVSGVLTRCAGAYGLLDEYRENLMEKGKKRRNPMAKKRYENAIRSYQELVLGRESDVLRDSLRMDSLLGKDYYATSEEVIARSFERVVGERVKEMKWRNDYLVSPGKNDEKAYRSLSDNFPYPYPSERDLEDRGVKEMVLDRFVRTLREYGVLSENSISFSPEADPRRSIDESRYVLVNVDIEKEGAEQKNDSPAPEESPERAPGVDPGL